MGPGFESLTAYGESDLVTLFFCLSFFAVSYIISIFEINLEDTFARSNKYSSKLDLSCSLIRIFEINLEDTFARSNKYSSKLDLSCSLIRIFAIHIYTKSTYALAFQNYQLFAQTHQAMECKILSPNEQI